MGLAASSSIVKNTVNSLTSVINSTVSNIIQDADTECVTTNVFKGNPGIYPATISNGQVTSTMPCVPQAEISSFTLSQNANNTCSLKEDLDSELNIKITNELSTNINQWLSSNAKANNGFLGFGVSIAFSEGINQIELSNMIANTISSNLSQNCKTILQASNNAELFFCGEYPNGIVEVQNAVNTSLTSCILNSTITNIENNDVLNGIAQKAFSEASASNQGIFSGLRWIVIAAVVIVALIIIGVLLYFIFGGSSKPKEGEVSPKTLEEEDILKARLRKKHELEQGFLNSRQELERSALERR